MSRYRLPDPKCRHASQPLRVSSHEDIVEASLSGDPMACTYCCERPACVEDAKEWVWAMTHRAAVVIPPASRLVENR